MGESKGSATGEGAQAARLPSFGEQLPRIAGHFSDAGALGIVLIDAQSLAGIETFYGGAKTVSTGTPTSAAARSTK